MSFVAFHSRLSFFDFISSYYTESYEIFIFSYFRRKILVCRKCLSFSDLRHNLKSLVLNNFVLVPTYHVSCQFEIFLHLKNSMPICCVSDSLHIFYI